MEENKNTTNYLNVTKGIMSWVYTIDHKRIGLMFLVLILGFFFVGGMAAMGVRMELWGPEKDLMDADTYNRFFTMHGIVMVFLFIVPSIPSALGNFILPMQLGAVDVAFPRLNLLSLYLYVLGAIIALFALFAGEGLDTGWTFYTPYSSQLGGSVIVLGIAIFVMGFSSILTGLNFIVTVHKLRVPGMTWFKLPLMIWALYATAVIQILATPVIGITVLLLMFESLFGIGIFDPAMGGDPVLFQHFFWFYSHPVVYIMILPAMGIISELISTFSHKRIFGYKAIAYSSIAIAFFSFMVWGHHMFVSGESKFAAVVFSFITFSVAVPSAIKIFNWLATMYQGSISLKTPMLYALSFIILFTIGGLTGVFLGALAVDVHLHDTYYVVAHFHYVMFGGTVVAFIGGLHYWWPKMTGKMFNEFWGKVGATLICIAFNLTFMPQFIAGFRGMPRRYYTYPAEFELLNQLSTIGALLLGFSFILVAINLLCSLKWGEKAPGNPWNALTMEWDSPSPPPLENFIGNPEFKTGPYDYDKIEVKHS